MSVSRHSRLAHPWLARPSTTRMGGQLDRLPVPLPFRAWLNRSWIDLAQPTGSENLSPWGVELAYQAFKKQEDLPRFNSVFPTSYRQLIAEVARQSRITVAIADPAEVVSGDRSERWAELCDSILLFQPLLLDQRDRLVWLLYRLCFHKLVADLTQEFEESLGDDSSASLCLTRALSLTCLAKSNGEHVGYRVFNSLWPRIPEDSRVAVEVSYHLLIQHTKTQPNIEKAIEAAQTHYYTIDRVSSRLSRFSAEMLWSRYHRVQAFIPMLTGDFDGMTRSMDLAEQIARNLAPCTNAERYAAQEILWPVLESRVREAQVLCDLPLAERRALTLIDAAPLNSRSWLHYGEVLLSLERFEEAASAYREAYRLGPPSSRVALFNLGQCYEMLSQAEHAMDAYAELLELDPYALSAAERITSIAGDRGGRYRNWAETILSTLTKYQSTKQGF